jgi:hypothetical protein
MIKFFHFLIFFFTCFILNAQSSNSVEIEGPIECQVWGPQTERRSTYIISLTTDNTDWGCETLTFTTELGAFTGGKIHFQGISAPTICLTEVNCYAECFGNGYVFDEGIDYYFEYDPITNTRRYKIDVEWEEPYPGEKGGKLYAIYKEKGSVKVELPLKELGLDGKFKFKLTPIKVTAKDEIQVSSYPRNVAEIKSKIVQCGTVELTPLLSGNTQPVSVDCEQDYVMFNGTACLRQLLIRYEWERYLNGNWVPYSNTPFNQITFNSSNPNVVNTLRVRNIANIIYTNLAGTVLANQIVPYSSWTVISFKTTNKPTQISGDQYISTGESLEQTYFLDAIPNTANWSAVPFFGLNNFPVINPLPGSAIISFPAIPEEELYLITVNGSSACGPYNLQYWVTVEPNKGGGNTDFKDLSVNNRTTAGTLERKFTVANEGDFTRVSFAQTQVGANVQLFDLNGKLRLANTVDGDTVQLSTADLPAGIYLLTIFSNHEYWTEKIVIVH